MEGEDNSNKSEGKEYVLGGSAAELDRIEAMHESTVTYIGSLFSAPVDFGQEKLRVLDSGTAGGRWLQDLIREKGPRHEYVGTDITPSFFPESHLHDSHPAAATPDLADGNNCNAQNGTVRAGEEISYHLQDVNRPWPVSWNESFDLVHQRFVLGAVPKTNLEIVARQLIGLVKPGGWIELMESDLPAGNMKLADQEEKEQDAAAPVWHLLRQLYLAMGSQPDLDGVLPGIFRATGLVDVQEKRVTVPVGVKRSSLSPLHADATREGGVGGTGGGPGLSLAQQDSGIGGVDVAQQQLAQLRRLQERSMHAIATTGRHLAGAARMMPGGVEGFTAEELEGLPDNVEERLQKEGGTYRVYCIWGRKPSSLSTRDGDK